MWFWVFLLAMTLFIPFTLIGFGKYFTKSAPKKINPVFGYRTAMSMKNEDTWVFAHQYCGRIWYVSGLIMLPFSVIAMLFVLGKTENAVGLFGGLVCLIQLIPLLVAVVLTEYALKKNFDRYGNRK